MPCPRDLKGIGIAEFTKSCTTYDRVLCPLVREDIDMGDDVDINTLTMEQYPTLIQDNIRPGIVKPKIGDGVEFEINGNFIKELRRKLFKVHLKKQKDNPYKTRKTVCMIGIPEKIHKNKAQEDEGDMDDGWDITIKDVERLRQILTPTIHTLPNLEPVVQPYMPRGPIRDEVKVVREEELEYDIPLQDGVMQPLTPQIVHITSPNDDYVAPAADPIFDKHLNECGKKFFDMTGVDKNGDTRLLRIQGSRDGLLPLSFEA
ncbi:hypothetical protein Tco_0934084 [Tanacetum coccineum]